MKVSYLHLAEKIVISDQIMVEHLNLNMRWTSESIKCKLFVPNLRESFPITFPDCV